MGFGNVFSVPLLCFKSRWMLLTPASTGQDLDAFPPVIANGPILSAAVHGPVESLEAQIARRSGITADQLDTIILRCESHESHSSPQYPNPRRG
jgi:hypothetical protein